MADRCGLVEPVTGLFGRDHFVRLAEREARRCERYGHPLAVVVLRLTGVRDDVPYNDGTIADLRATATACAVGLREPDLLSYIGDGSFALALPETDETGARRVADRLAGDAMRALAEIAKRTGRASVQAGAALCGKGPGAIGRALNQAEAGSP